uniref:Uncharacterized protein n=1 Tax=Odontella aurita TaxID=265563 RepID=A0A7S4MQS8_9STRA|mmetsp:Transcript_28639/g.84377  ORF Transcript_28639/g.84377 Transcript_28639/m.84377 type:complete len:112 (+) Transcript_28639:1166-1501(+)
MVDDDTSSHEFFILCSTMAETLGLAEQPKKAPKKAQVEAAKGFKRIDSIFRPKRPPPKPRGRGRPIKKSKQNNGRVGHCFATTSHHADELAEEELSMMAMILLAVVWQGAT